MSKKLDEVDYRILYALQKDSAVSMKKLAEKVHLSESPCWRRVQKLEEQGYIKNHVCLLDANKLGCEVSVIVMIKVGGHKVDRIEVIRKFMDGHDHVQSCHRVSGEVDYVIKVRANSVQQYDLFYRDLIAVVEPESVHSCIALEVMKDTHQLPLAFEPS